MRTPRSLTIALLLALAGVALSILLVMEHHTVWEGGLAEGFFCGGVGRFDCNAVARHEASWLLGVPLALWGLLFYLGIAGLVLLALVLPPGQATAASGVAWLLSLTAIVLDVWLAVVMVREIGAICLQCVASYAINLGLAISLAIHHLRSDVDPAWKEIVLSWRWSAEDGGRPRVPRAKAAIAGVVLVALGAAVVLAGAPVLEQRRFEREEALDLLARLDEPAEVDMARFEGRPARGPRDAPLVIAVSADFQCTFCRSLASTLEELRREHPDSIRIVFLSSPVSSACNPAIRREVHENACWLADFGACAAAQGKFWAFHDELFERMSISGTDQESVWRRLPALGIDSAQVRVCINSGAAREAVARDVALSRELELFSTPSVVINGHPQRGGVYPAALRAVVRAYLARSRPAPHGRNHPPHSHRRFAVHAAGCARRCNRVAANGPSRLSRLELDGGIPCEPPTRMGEFLATRNLPHHWKTTRTHPRIGRPANNLRLLPRRATRLEARARRRPNRPPFACVRSRA